MSQWTKQTTTTAPSNNQWAGKTWAAMGDSITEGYNTTKIYHQVVSANLAMGTVTNYGIGGTNLSANTGSHPTQGMCDRIKTITTADLITVFGGTNDYGNSTYAALGDITSTDTSTVYGALHSIAQTLLTTFTTSKYAFFTPLQRADNFAAATGVITLGKGANSAGVYLSDIADAIIAVGKYYSIPVLDLHRVSGLQPSYTAIINTYMPDKLHPNAAGHTKIASIITQFLMGI